MTRCQYWRGRRTACVPFWMAIRSWCAAFADSSVDILLGDLFDGDSRSNGRAIVIRWCEPALCVFSEGLNGTCNNRVDSKAMLARDSWIDDIGRYFFSFPRALRLARRFGSVRPKGGGKAGGGDVDGNRGPQPSRVIAFLKGCLNNVVWISSTCMDIDWSPVTAVGVPTWVVQVACHDTNRNRGCLMADL